MSLFRGSGPKPNMGDYRIIKETRRNGRVAYHVEKYDWGVADSKGWQYVTSLPTLAYAEDHILKLQGSQVLTREVVWP